MGKLAMTIDRHWSRSLPFVLCLLFLFTESTSYSQTTILTGEMTYTQTEILSVDPASNSVLTTDASGFDVDDRVLLIKMQGASISEANDGSFGTIGNTNGVGLYEIGRVCSVLGNRISFQYRLTNDYTSAGVFSGKMQMILIPQYEDVVITGTLTAPAWDGTFGGVLIFEASGTVEFQGDIDMTAKGFHGGHSQNSVFACTPSTNPTNAGENSLNYFYDLASGEGACKGEGISGYVANKEAGKGKLANGGGGGNNFNAGGGGGANYGTGGNGGTRQATASDPLAICRGEQPGLPGTSLATWGYSTANNRIFLGGGGGAGHADSNEGGEGGYGGGIVIIKADQIDGRNHAIYANGGNGDNTGSDGAPGGGGGGAVLIDVNIFTSRPLLVEAKGGNGGGSNMTGSDCMGPGGGGGGGVVWTKYPLGPVVTTDVSGGINGYTAGTSGCGGGGIASNGAFPGLAGAVVSGLSLPEETVAFTSCVLAAQTIDLQAISLAEQVNLSWRTSETSHVEAFMIERSIDGKVFESLARIAPLKSLEGEITYEYIDKEPLHGKSFYRLKEIDKSGSFIYSPTTEVSLNLSHQLKVSMFPNPYQQGESLQFEFQLAEAGWIQVAIYDLSGRQVFAHRHQLSAQRQRIELATPNLAPGTYYMRATAGEKHANQKLVVL